MVAHSGRKLISIYNFFTLFDVETGVKCTLLSRTEVMAQEILYIIFAIF